jgi:hypothetical protein
MDKRWPKKQAIKITKRNYEAALARAVDVIFEVAAHDCNWTWRELASEAKLSYCTVYRLGSRITRYPRWQTFWKLANAVGLDLVFINPDTGQVVLPQSLKAVA